MPVSSWGNWDGRTGSTRARPGCLRTAKLGSDGSSGRWLEERRETFRQRGGRRDVAGAWRAVAQARCGRAACHHADCQREAGLAVPGSGQDLQWVVRACAGCLMPGILRLCFRKRPRACRAASSSHRGCWAAVRWAAFRRLPAPAQAIAWRAAMMGHCSLPLTAPLCSVLTRCPRSWTNPQGKPGLQTHSGVSASVLPRRLLFPRPRPGKATCSPWALKPFSHMHAVWVHSAQESRTGCFRIAVSGWSFTACFRSWLNQKAEGRVGADRANS